MTTENLAILFTDVVGSTELSQRVSAQAADDVRRGHFSLLRRAIAETGGTEVKNVGDGLMVVFGSGSSALACGVAMQQAVERDNRHREHPVGLRVGLSAGEVSPEEDDYFGDPVVEAARLCARAESGQILATELVRAIAGRRAPHTLRPLGALNLKGLRDAVPTCEVEWEPAIEPVEDPFGVPLPRRMTRRPGVGVIGRGPEISGLSEAYKRAAAGEGREAVLISGEAGLGKTTLVAAAAQAAFDRGACVLYGHCEEDLATPYQLFAQALAHYVTHAEEEVILAHVAEHGSELARLVPALWRRIPGLPPSKATNSDTERYLLFAAVVGLLATASQHRPVVLVLDDLQWADTGSLQLLRHLAAGEHQMRVLVLGTYRDSELARSHPLLETLGALHRHGGVTRIDLKGFDDSEVILFLEAAAGHGLDTAGVGLAHAVYRETDGNPFFVGEVLRHLSETGAIYQDETGRWVGTASLEDMALPDSVREVVGARVVRLGAGAERTLSLAAVIGRDFDLEVLARATETSEEELLDLLDAAAAAALVRELSEAPGRYTFSHALIQHTLYENLGTTRRARAHTRVAEALEDVCQGRPGQRVGELARHWFSATQPKDLTRALDYSRQAADAALEALAPHDALRYYTQALDLYAHADDDPLLAIDLAIGQGTAQRQSGDPAFRETLLDAARRSADLGDTNRLVAAALANDRGLFSSAGVVDTEKVEILEMALESLTTDQPERALVLATLCSELAHGSALERRQALADEALAIAEGCDDGALIVRVLNSVFPPLWVPQLLDVSLARTAEALARAEVLGDPALIFFAAVWRAIAVVRSGDMDEMDRCVDIAASEAEQLDQPFFYWAYTLIHVARALVVGDVERAERLATEALQIGTDCGQPDAALWFGAQLMIVNLQRGMLGELVPLIEQMGGEVGFVGVISAALAMAHGEADRTEAAASLLAQFSESNFEAALGPVWMTVMVAYADAAIEVRNSEYAGPLFEKLAPWADQFSTGGNSAEGPVSYYVGGLAAVLGHFDEADAYFAQSAAMSERMGAKFFAARTDLLWGKMLTERGAPGDVQAASGLLTSAYASATNQGYANVARRASEALEVLGADPEQERGVDG